MRGWLSEIRDGGLYQGLETEKILAVLLDVCASGERPDMEAVAQSLESKDRRLLFEIAFEGTANAEWSEAESCLDVLRLRRAEEELSSVQRQIESYSASANGAHEPIEQLLARKLDLRRRLSDLRETTDKPA